eukprot:352431-Chlamydomonas_euryale.AAC.8
MPRRVAAGHSTKFVALGGSITFGIGAWDGSDSWVKRLASFAAAVWPAGNVQVINGAFGGISSSYLSTCVSVRVATGVLGSGSSVDFERSMTRFCLAMGCT